MENNNSSKDSFLKEIEEIKEKNFDKLRAYPNVTGVGVGFKVMGGKRTEEVCIRVYVSKKLPLKELRTEEVIPTEVEGIPVDIIEATFEIQSVADHQDRCNPILGGISIGNLSLGGSGTLGVSVFDNISREDMILSNWHVLCGRNNCNVGEVIIQPGSGGGDGGTSNDIVAHLHRFILSGQDDVAVARLNGDRFLLKTILNLGEVMEVGTHSLNMHVRKSGRTTGVTEGYITDINSTIDIRGYPGGTREFRNQILIENGVVSRRGDSGSVWINDSNQVIGLHFAGSTDGSLAIANRISSVLQALDINLKSGVTMHGFIAATSSLLF